MVARKLFFYALAIGLTALGIYMAVTSSSLVEAFFKLVFVTPLVFGAVWQANWGFKRTKWGRAEEPAPSFTERTFATSWLWFRRVVCVLGTLLFCVFGVQLALVSNWQSAAFFFSIALFALAIGFIGSSANGGLPGMPKAELRSYRERKRRYGWRW
jgi:hypothetical protein